MKVEKIIKKIESLGKREKVAPKPSGSSPRSQNFDEVNKYNLPSIYLEISKKYGSFSFEKWIMVKSVDTIPISENGYVSVDGFYAFEDAFQLFNEYKEQLPSGMIPFSDGEPGDLICIASEGEKNGKIYYWHHESPKNKDLYLLANDLEQFILSLEIFEEKDEEPGDEKITKVQLSDDFINMLKKDGFGPK